MPFTLDFGGTPYDSFAGTGIVAPTSVVTGISVGDLLDPIGDVAKSAGGDLLQAGIGAITDEIGKLFQTNTGSAGTVAVRAGAVQSLGALYQYMQGKRPPASNANLRDRGNYVLDLCTPILGIPREVVWRNEQSKQDSYELFRAYLMVFDKITGNRYNLAAPIPPHDDPCPVAPSCSVSVNVQPYTLYTKLNQIGASGLSAIDAVINGQELDSSTIEYLTDKAQTSGGTTNDGGTNPSALDQLLDALKGAVGDLVQTGKNVVTGTVEGAATGARTTTAGAAQGSALGGSLTNLLGSMGPLLFVGAIVVVILLLRKK